jgi:MarR-like DNA-binding transcriptional regulator SgrR of sgrS sRNA
VNGRRDFLVELLEDLPNLFKEQPQGVTLTHLHEWFGESQQKLSRAVKQLSEERLLDLAIGPQNTILVFPKGKSIPANEHKLTPLQDKLYKALRDAYTAKGASLHTNYAQLAKVCQASYGGTRAALQKLVQLQLIQVEHESERGKQDQLVLAVQGASK